MAKDSATVTFVVLGQAAPAGARPAGLSSGQVKASARVGARRAGGEAVRLEATPGEDIVLLHIANGPTLYLHPEDARELLRAQQGSQLSRGAPDAQSPDGDVSVPAQLAWDDLGDEMGVAGTRGKVTQRIGNVVLDAVEVVTGLFKDKAADIAAAAVTKRLDDQVEPGVYQLEANELPMLKGVGRKLASVPAPAKAGDPLLVLVHGTFSNTSGTFSKLWQQHPSRVVAIFKQYGARVYGLEHETLGVSPFGNALNLVRALPEGACLHLMTHSRGGIVAEVLARLCGGHGTSKADLALFEGKGYEQHRADLDALAREIRRRKIKVDRVVRVACPARGTLLASRRLDAYLSVLKWSMELAGVLVLPQLVDFLAEVARRRTDPAELPGIEAMMPDRPMTKWLNAPAEPLSSELRVVAGDIEGDSVMTWLKTLLSDAFYWTDNDLVVQTRSMYGGTPRENGKASFVLDRGGKVTHFNYFGSEHTAGLLTSALIEKDPEQFRPIGPLSWAGEDAGGTRAARAARLNAGNVAERPAVFVLPGILGSHLKVDGKRVWLSARFISGLERLRWDPSTASRIAPDGPVGMSYDDLIDHLAATHEVFPFAFDWRRPIEDEARRLAVEVDEALTVRDSTLQPVRIVAHSMGGLVARTMRLESPETWRRLMARPKARFLMLGTPNGGSFAPMQVLSGDDSFGNLFTTWGGLFDGLGQRKLVAGMPGLLQLQAGLVDGELNLGLSSTWEELQELDLKKVRRRISQRAFWHRDPAQQREMSWGIPTQAVLDQAVALRKRLDAQQAELAADGNTLLVVGSAKATPARVKRIEEDERVVYLDTAEGDGRVTLENALLPGVPTWQVDVVHGELANAKKAFDAYVELLETGATTQLPTVTPRASRSAATDLRAPILVYSRPSRTMRADMPPSVMNEVFAAEPERDRAAVEPGMRLSVRVLNANLKFVREPLLVGHYESLKLTGTEWVIDDLIGNTMSEALRCGAYPADIGSNQIFTNSRRPTGNPFAMPRPEAAIVVGLGEEGSLRMSELIETIRQGTLAYAQRLVENEGVVPTTFSIASTLIGSGGTAISPATSAQAVALGVAEANTRLADIGWPIVSHLQLIEMYRDRATEALNALKAFADSMSQGIEVEPRIAIGQGALPRPVDGGYRGVNSDFVSIREQLRTDGSSEFEFTLSTRRARDEVRGAVAQSKLMQYLVSKGATDENEDAGIGRALFKLLVPLEIEPFLAGSTSLVLQLDTATAAYPWEMLDIDRNDVERTRGAPPWGIQTRLLRKLRTETFRVKPRTADSSTGVLVIGEPQCPPNLYPRLPGAVAEAREIARLLGVNPLLNKQAKQITQAVLNSSFAILHVSGHGDFIKENGKDIGGVVLSDGMLFSAREVESMRIVPQLAFINCCHLGRVIDTEAPSTWRDSRPKLAANVAEQLIRIGVRCVIAAGWAVDDDAAMLFAETFYRKLLLGWRFIDAVAEARARTYDRYPRSNTWAAYQCYGDPDWTYQGTSVGKADGGYAPEVASADDLRVHLETIAVNHKFDDLEDDERRMSREADRRQQLTVLEGLAARGWNRHGAVAAAFGAAYAEIEDFERAIAWYERATAAADGSAGLKALEQLGNLMARHGANTGNRAQIETAIDLLKRVHAIGETVERKSLLGSAYKRLSQIAGTEREKHAALSQSLAHYKAAAALARKLGSADFFYPAINRMSLELILRGAKAGTGLDRSEVDEVRRSLSTKNVSEPDFWSVIAETELTIYEAVALGDLAAALDRILLELSDIVRRARSSREWNSVTEQIRLTLEHYRSTPGLSQAERRAIEKLLQALPAGNAKAAKGMPAVATTRKARTKTRNKRPTAKKK